MVPELGGPGGPLAPPIFGRPVNPIPTMGDRFCPPFTSGTPNVFHLPASLKSISQKYPKCTKSAPQIAPEIVQSNRRLTNPHFLFISPDKKCESNLVSKKLRLPRKEAVSLKIKNNIRYT